ncbi:glycosyltransferase family 2 protein [Candidatus Uhrbacteria bacterium]|nr:glycosyltransferase family 2 protein [Candidatus Uhrbacteria bacterium]
MRVAIVIPMHNEAAVAERCVETVMKHCRALPQPTTLLVVDDGSRDATGAILQRMHVQYDHYLQYVTHPTNRGYGAALRTGMHYVIDGGYDYVIFMDSDLTNHPRYLTLFYGKMDEGWDYIKASRYIIGGATIGVPRVHQFLSRWGNRLAHVLYGIPIHDCTNGFRAVRVALLRAMHLQESGFPIIMEELTAAKALGASFCEVPYTLTSRGTDEGVSHLSYGPRTWRPYLRHALAAARSPYHPKAPNPSAV